MRSQYRHRFRILDFHSASSHVGVQCPWWSPVLSVSAMVVRTASGTLNSVISGDLLWVRLRKSTMASLHDTRACARKLLIGSCRVFDFPNFSPFLGFCGDSMRYFMLNKTVKNVFPKNVVKTSPENHFWSPALVAGFIWCRCAVDQYRGVANGIHKHLFGDRSATGEHMSCYINWVSSVRL